MNARRPDPKPQLAPDVLTIQVLRAQDFTSEEMAQMLALCSDAFEMDYQSLYHTFEGAVHVLGMLGGELVSHALWVSRWLEVGESDLYTDGLGLLRTAYVEAVATHADYRRRGYATAVMRRLAREVANYDLSALSTGTPELYEPLGWETWRGPLYVRQDGEARPTPDEGVMILRLPGTPPLDLEAPLSCDWREGEVW